MEQEDEMEAENDNAKLDQSFENEDPSWTPEEVDAAYKKENDGDGEESSKPR